MENKINKSKNKNVKYIIIIMVALILALIFLLQFKTSENLEQVEDLHAYFETLVNTITSTGKLTLDDYNSLITKLNNNGNNYQLFIELQKGDTDVKSEIDEETGVGIEMFQTTYTSQILDSLNNTGEYLFKEGDIICVQIINSKSKEVVASQSGMVTINGN